MNSKINNKCGIIYMFTCNDTNKSYIGQTVNPKERFKCHLKNGLYNKTNHPFYIDIAKYNNWTYTILETNIERGEKLNSRELFYITKYNTMYPNGYNLRYGASFRGKTINFSEHHKQALKESWTDDRKQKASETQKKAQLNYWSSQEGKIMAKHHSEVMKGRETSEETKKKISQANKGHVVSIETRKKLSDSNKGHKASIETRKKQSESHKGHTPGNKGKHLVWDNKELYKFHYE